MANNDELLNTNLGDDPIDPEPMEEQDPIYTLIALHKKSKPSEKVAIEIDKYDDYKKSYIVDGVALYNEDLGINFMIALEEGTRNFGVGPEDIPETDPLRKHYTNPTMTSLDGQWRTNWLLEHETQINDGAVMYCKTYGDNYWLPSGGEMSYIQSCKNDINKALKKVGGTIIEDEYYWTSSKFNNNYAWSLNIGTGEFAFWKSKKTMMKVRPVTTLEDYKIIKED
jgi:hypothetical protein